jgi:hypothetical protein
MRPVIPRRLAALAAALSVVLLAGCGLSPIARQDTGSPFYPVPEGSVIDLHEPVQIRPGVTRAWIQRGEPTGQRFDRYAVSCNFEVRELDYDNAQVIEPGRFEVRRTQQVREEVVRKSSPVLLAGLLTLGGMDGDGSAMIHEGYHLWLDNPDQPDVMRLTCRGAFDDAGDALPPTIDQIRAALGPVATLELAD